MSAPEIFQTYTAYVSLIINASLLRARRSVIPILNATASLLAHQQSLAQIDSECRSARVLAARHTRDLARADGRLIALGRRCDPRLMAAGGDAHSSAPQGVSLPGPARSIHTTAVNAGRAT
jgi:hypothetical protein